MFSLTQIDLLQFFPRGNSEEELEVMGVGVVFMHSGQDLIKDSTCLAIPGHDTAEDTR